MHRESEENNYFIFSYLIFQNLVTDGWVRKEIAPNSCHLALIFNWFAGIVSAHLPSGCNFPLSVYKTTFLQLLSAVKYPAVWAAELRNFPGGVLVTLCCSDWLSGEYSITVPVPHTFPPTALYSFCWCEKQGQYRIALWWGKAWARDMPTSPYTDSSRGTAVCCLPSSTKAKHFPCHLLPENMTVH